MMVEGHEYSIEIYRIDTIPQWSLEVHEDGTSTVWDDLFDIDQEALDEVMKAIQEEGLGAFRDTGNVVPFPSS